MRLHHATTGSTTTISNHFIDDYMPSANGNYVKIYLYLLRLIQADAQEVSISSISDYFDYTEGDVLRALRYWEKEQLIQLTRTSNGSISDLQMLEPKNKTQNKLSERKTEPSPSYTPNSGKETYTATYPQTQFSDYTKQTTSVEKQDTLIRKEIDPEEINQLKENDSVFSTILLMAQSHLERPLTPKDIQTATFIYRQLKFSPELIFYLYDYCVGERHKKRPEYIEKVAISWHKEGIRTPEQATKAMIAYNEDYIAVCQAFGLNRMPGKIELDYIDRWVKQMGFDKKMIEAACSRTLLKIQKPDFKYANSILESWYREGVHTPADIARQDQLHKQKKVNTPSKPTTNNKFNQFPQRNYTKEDYSSLEKKLLEKSRNS